MSTLQIFLAGYGILALGHIGVQMLLAHIELRREKMIAFDPDWAPSVTVIVPVFNEKEDILHECLRSIDAQNYPELEVLVVDDGSIRDHSMLAVLEEFSDGRFRVLLKPNSGKRLSQRAVLDAAGGEVIVTVDSDTRLDPVAISAIVQRFSDPRVGAVTADVGANNRGTNLLTKLIGYRYWMAFHQERAAQSLFGVTMCCSGPFSAYRKEIIDRVKDQYAAQVFLGQKCTFGDDRHLTNLVLEEGHRVVFDRRAHAETQVPATIPRYIRQQTRWNKSFYREALWTMRFAHRRHPYLAIDLTLQLVLPFMLLGALGAMAYQAVLIDPAQLLSYVLILVGIALVRSLSGLVRTRDPGFLLFVIYGFIHVLVLIPVRLYALATLGTSHWGTREPVAPAAKRTEVGLGPGTGSP